METRELLTMSRKGGGGLFAEAIQAIHDGSSVSRLFRSTLGTRHRLPGHSGIGSCSGGRRRCDVLRSEVSPARNALSVSTLAGLVGCASHQRLGIFVYPAGAPLDVKGPGARATFRSRRMPATR